MEGNLGQPILAKIKTPIIDGKIDIPAKIALQYLKYIQNDPTGKSILNKLEVDNRVNSLVGQTINRGNSWTSYSLQNLAAWYAWVFNDAGQEAAETQLNAFLDSDLIDVEYVSWLTNIDIDEPLSISDSISLHPLSTFKDTTEYFEFNTIEVPPTERRILKPKCCLVEQRNEPKIYSQDIQPFSFQAHNDLADLISLLGKGECRIFRSTAYALNCPPSFFSGRSSFYPVFDIMDGGESFELSPEDLQKLREIYQGFENTTAQNKERIRLATNRFSQAKRRQSVPDKILDICISLEVMLLSDAGKEQLSKTFRLRGAWLIGETKDERRRIFDILKMLYRLRSSVVHSGKISEQEYEMAKLNMESFTSTTEKIIQKLILDAPADWNDLILGD